MAHLCTLTGIRHSPRTACSPWTNGIVEVQNRNLGTHLRMFLHDTPKDWTFQVHMYAYAHNSQPLSTKINLHIKNFVHIVTERITPSLLVSKNNEMMKKKEMHMQSQHKNFLYSTSVPLLMINTMIIDIEVEVPRVTTLTTKTINKIDTVLHLEIDLAMTKVLLLHNTLDHDMILTNAFPGLTALHTDLRIDLLIDTTLALDIDHAPIPETIILRNIQLHTDHLLNQEILDFLDPVHTPILETELIWYNHKTNLTL